MDLRLKDKVAIVTGGGRGIGEAICMAFANKGAHVAVNDINSEGALNVSEKIKSIGGKVIAVVGDISKLEDVTRLMKLTLDEFGKIDILINNAAISPKKEGGGPTMTWEVELEEWDRVMDVNLKGTFLCSREAVKFMLSRKSGTIINISSVAGKAPFEPMATGCHYDASKAAIINLTQRLASEVASKGIRVNGVCPGRIETPLTKFSSQKWNEIMLNRTPMGRYGTTEEVSSLVLYLASNISGFITGETVSINGGWFMD
jgi:3-oxoacyl-[acyl-carrier protein] reductase